MRNGSWDVIIVGGGPAGLSAALTLGRCRRRVLVCDAGRHRNRASRHVHCLLTREGISPAELIALAHKELSHYDGVQLRLATVVDADQVEDGFTITLDDGTREHGRKLLLATGVVDELPAIPGIEQLYGRSVHHCPYCDAWEWRDHALAVYGRGEKGAGLALMLRQWSADVVLVTDGPCELDARYRERLTFHGIDLREDPIARLEGTPEGFLERIVFANGTKLERNALFFNTGQHQRSPLAAKLGCEFSDKGGVEAHEHQVATTVPGLYVAGDASRDVQLVAVALAEGAKAAFAINKALLEEQGLG